MHFVYTPMTRIDKLYCFRGSVASFAHYHDVTEGRGLCHMVYHVDYHQNGRDLNKLHKFWTNFARNLTFDQAKFA